MAWSTARKATAEDQEKLQAVMDRFSERHNVLAENVLYVNDDGMVGGGSYLLDRDGVSICPERAREQRRYLLRNIQRAIGGEGIAYGYVGNQVE